MRRISRLDRSIDLLRTRATVHPPPAYLCAAGKHHASPLSTSTLRAASDGKATLTEKLRRKIWGTDNPPGSADPYGDNSVFDQTKRRERERQIKEGEEEVEETKAEETEAEETKAEETQAEQTKAEEVIQNPADALYEPAHTWDGLKRVGFREARWDAKEMYTSFVPRNVKTDSQEITAALHRAMVEVFALKEAGTPLENILKDSPGEDLTRDVTFDRSPTGPEMKFMDGALPREDLVASLTVPGWTSANQVEVVAVHEEPTESEEDVAADRSTVDPVQPDAETAADDTVPEENAIESEDNVDAGRKNEELIASWGPHWLELSLEDPEIKFAVLKRLMQLTGIRIPDARLNACKTPGALLKILIAPPKPRKLVEALIQKDALINLPNVSVHSHRITPVDKEKAVGRWKVIEETLQARGLPLFGHRKKRASF